MTTDKEPPSSYRTLLVSRRGAVARLALNRPRRRNALDAALQADLRDALSAVAADGEVRAVILTGEGPAFCAGLDLHDLPESLAHLQAAQGHDAGSSDMSVFAALEAVPQPVIGAINGPAITGGLELALGCDILIAGRTARFADTHAAVGVLPGAGMTQKLSRIVGQPRAMALSLLGEPMDAEEAHRLGLVSHLAAPDALDDLAWQLAERIAEAPPEIVREIKRLVREGARTTLGEGLRLERAAHFAWAREAAMEPVLRRRDTLLQLSRSTEGRP